MHKKVKYINHLYNKENYLRGYSYSIPPIEDPRFLPRIDVTLKTTLPSKVGPGRPRMNRRKDPMKVPRKLKD